MSNDIKYTSTLVKSILEIDPQTRNDDNLLYLRVIEQEAMWRGINLENLSVPAFLLNLKELKFPAFETVRRTRQKTQVDYPELAADDRVNEGRSEREKEFRAYARGEA